MTAKFLDSMGNEQYLSVSNKTEMTRELEILHQKKILSWSSLIDYLGFVNLGLQKVIKDNQTIFEVCNENCLPSNQ